MTQRKNDLGIAMGIRCMLANFEDRVVLKQPIQDIQGLKALQPGNTLVVWKLDRLGRDLKHLVNTVDELRQRQVHFKVLSGAGAEIDTTTANGRLFFAVFAALAEYERELIAERTRAGLQAARARGRMGGRPRKMDQTTLHMAMSAMSDPMASAKEVARKLGITTATLYTYVNGDCCLMSSERLPSSRLKSGQSVKWMGLKMPKPVESVLDARVS